MVLIALEAAGLVPPVGIDGASLLPILQGRPDADLRRNVYFVRREGGAAYGDKAIEALLQGDWKLLQDSPFTPLELYNLKDDPKEATNLAGQQRKVFNELSAEPRRHIQRGGSVPWQPPAASGK